MTNKNETVETLELLIELVEGLVQEEGFKTLRYSGTDSLGTIEYDCLVLKDSKGKEYTISFDESLRLNRTTKKTESTNHIKFYCR